MLGITVAKARYEKWWLGKHCRPADAIDKPFKKVKAIDVIGPPSFVYGQITLCYEDGTEDIVGGGWIGHGWQRRNAYKPRKIDVEVQG